MGHADRYRALRVVIIGVISGFSTVGTVTLEAASGVIISEFQARNDATLADEDGEFPDWVELYNADDRAVQLVGWHLTDDPLDPTRWKFPDVEIPARGFLRVFCSGKDRIDSTRPLHTNFKLKSRGEYLALIEADGATVAWQFSPRFKRQVADVSYGFVHRTEAEILVGAGATASALVPEDASLGLDWVNPAFADAAWIPGTVAFGFDQKSRPTYTDLIETDIGPGMRRVNSSVYIRIPFEFDPRAPFDFLRLRVKFADGFVAYLNGSRIASANAPGNPVWNSKATAAQNRTRAKVFQNFDISAFLELLQPGENLLAIHGLNNSVSSSDFFVLPEIVGVRADEIDTTRRQYFDEPSAAWPNGEGFDDISGEPDFSRLEGAYAGSVELALSATAPAAVIRYTTNGTVPDEDSTVYESPLTLSVTTAVRARVFEPGLLPGPTVERNYVILATRIVDDSSNIPLVIVNTFGRSIGGSILTPMHIHIVDVGADGRAHLTGTPDFSGRGGIKTRGSSTGGRAKVSFSFEIWDEENEDRDVSILGMPPESDWILYGAYNFDRALIRNAFVYEISNQVGRYAVRTRSVELYVNRSPRAVGTATTDYFGVYTLMEKIKIGPERVNVERIGASVVSEPQIGGGYMFKIDRNDPGDVGFTAGSQQMLWVYPKEIDMRWRPAQTAWVRSHFDAFRRTITAPNAEDPELGYQKYIDLDSWIDHHLINELTKNPDALRLSTFFFKSRLGKIEYGPVWDFDRTMGCDDDARAQNPVGWMGPHSQGWWGQLLRQPTFERRYRQRWRQFRRGPMSIVNMHAIIDRMADEIREAQVRNFRRWPLALGAPGGPAGWEGEIIHLKRWVSDRANWMDTQFLEIPRFSPEEERVERSTLIEILVDDEESEIYYTLDGTDPKLPNGSPSASAQRYTGPIEIVVNTRLVARVHVGGGTWGGPAEAVYVVDLLPLAITEILFEPELGTKFEFVEIFNHGEEPVDLRGVAFRRGVLFVVENPDEPPLLPGEYAVVVNELEEFSSHYDTDSIRILGEYTGSFSNRGETVRLAGPIGETLVGFRFEDEWYPETQAGRSLVLRDPRVSHDLLEDPSSWRASAEVGGSPGRADPPDGEGGGQIPGDGNQDGRLNIVDAIHLLRVLFQGMGGLPCAAGSPDDEANRQLLDVNGDGGVDTADAIFTISYIYLDGSAPVQGVKCVAIPRCPEVCALAVR